MFVIDHLGSSNALTCIGLFYSPSPHQIALRTAHVLAWAFTLHRHAVRTIDTSTPCRARDRACNYPAAAPESTSLTDTGKVSNYPEGFAVCVDLALQIPVDPTAI